MRVLITGITGSTGSHLADQLIDEGHTVAGLVRGQQDPVLHSGQRPYFTVRGDLTDFASMVQALRDTQPDIVYHLGAVTSIGQSWRQQELMTNVTGMGTLRLLQAVRIACPAVRVVIASSADQFGDYSLAQGEVFGPAPDSGTAAADESTPFAPRSPYAVAKQFGHDTALTYRQAYGLHVSTLLLFNHTGPRHGSEFVVRKVTAGAARCAKHGGFLKLGNLDAARDWGYAPDFARAYPLAVEQDEPGDYVIATGKIHTLRELCETAFDAVGLDWTSHVRSEPALHRPTDVAVRVGNPAKAERVLGWSPAVDFYEMIAEMTKKDYEALS